MAPCHALDGAIIRLATDPRPDRLSPRSTLDATLIAIATRAITTLGRTAEAFEHGAALAQHEADRRAASGRDDADEERQVAARAREGAQHARSQADEWRRYLRERV